MPHPRRIIGALTVCLLATFASSQITFERQHYAAANDSSVFAAADLNHDGATDLIVARLAGLGLPQPLSTSFHAASKKSYND
jgi:hypothetical protein